MSDDRLKQNIHSLKKQLRLSMNGVVSSSMREKGLDYKLNFGVSIPQLKQIAEKYHKDDALADYCWKSNSREMKMLSAMLQPVESFTPELMDERMSDMPSFEIVQQYCMHLFQYMPFAEEKALAWINQDDTMRLAGYLLLSRLFMIRKEISRETTSAYLECAQREMSSDNSLQLKNMVVNSLKRFGKIDEEKMNKVLSLLSAYEFSKNAQEREWFQDAKFHLEN